MIPQKPIAHTIKEFTQTYCFNNELKFYLTSCYFHDHELGFPIGMHSHSFYEINVIVEGDGVHYMENNAVDAKKGSVFIIPPNVQHGYWTENPSSFKIFHILLSLGFTQAYKQELLSLSNYSTIFEIEPQLRLESKTPYFLVLSDSALQAFSPEFEKVSALDDTADNQIVKNGWALSFVAKLSNLYGDAYRNQTHAEHIKQKSYSSLLVMKTMEYITKNYTEKITIDYLAKTIHMSRSSYIRHFHSLCKCSPIDYLFKIRVKHATERLLSTNQSITDIALNCGFYDSAHFSRYFKQYYQCTPSAYRKYMRAANKEE